MTVREAIPRVEIVVSFCRFLFKLLFISQYLQVSVSRMEAVVDATATWVSAMRLTYVFFSFYV